MKGDWGVAARIALVGQVGLFLGGVVVTLVAVLAQLSADGIDRIDWAATAIGPPLAMLVWAGGTEGAPLLVTGVLYTFLAYRFAAQRLGSWLQGLFGDRARTVALAVKVGILASAILLAVGILLNSFADDLIGQGPGALPQSPVDLTTLVFFTIFVGAVIGLLALLSAGRAGLLPFLGVPYRGSMLVRAGAGGARRTLLIGGAALLVLSTLGSLLDRVGQAGVGLTDALGELLATLTLLVVQWLDQAMLLLLGSAKFLQDGGFSWAASSAGVEAWMWLSLPILLLAYVFGGIAAAKAAAASSQSEAMKFSLLVGPFVALVSLVVAFGWASQFDDIIAVAILVPTLWGIVAVGGAWLWASQQGLPGGLSVDTVRQPSAGAPAAPWTPGSTSPPPSGGPPPPGPAGGWAPPPPSPGGAHPPPPPSQPPAQAPTGSQPPTPPPGQPPPSPPPGPTGSGPEPTGAEAAGTPPQESAGVACPSCGTVSHGRFCGHCGTRVAEDA